MLRNLNRSTNGRRVLGVPYVGIIAAAVASQTATGDSGPGLLYDEASAPANAGKQLRLRITSLPPAGAWFFYENGAFSASGLADGIYSIDYSWYADNAIGGSDSATITVGTPQPDAVAPGGDATGQGAAAGGEPTGGQHNVNTDWRSKVDITKPVHGNPTTQSVRDNFATIKAELEYLASRIAELERNA